MKNYAEQIRPFMPKGRAYKVLGTDGFGRSDFRSKLREHFEVNRHYIVVAALKALADEGAVPRGEGRRSDQEVRHRRQQDQPAVRIRRRRRHDMALVEVKVPDIGDFKDVEIIELLVKPGDAVKAEQSLITVESDKASMEIPSSHAGVVKELKVKLGDKVSEGVPVLVLDAQGAGARRLQLPAPPPRQPLRRRQRRQRRQHRRRPQPRLRPLRRGRSKSSCPTSATSPTSRSSRSSSSRATRSRSSRA